MSSNRNLPNSWEPTGREITITFRLREFRHKETNNFHWCHTIRTECPKSIEIGQLKQAYKKLAKATAFMRASLFFRLNTGKEA